MGEVARRAAFPASLRQAFSGSRAPGRAVAARRGRAASVSLGPRMSGWYRAIWPLLRRIDPETAHRLAVRALRAGLVPRPRLADDPILHQRLWGLDFANPVGLAAGFDKHAEVPDA